MLSFNLLMIYLDNNGTTEIISEVREALTTTLSSRSGNPASLGPVGSVAREMLERARKQVAAVIGATAEQIVFVSSGSEANVSVIRSVLSTSDQSVLVMSEIEHSASMNLIPQLEDEGYEVRQISVLSNGVIDLEMLESSLDERVALVSVQAVNNETGVLQPVDKVASLCRAAGVVFHSDAAQAVGKCDASIQSIPADYITFTGHKFHGPAGVGLIFSKAGWDNFHPLITGGSQEFGVRGGTHNLIGIVGTGVAAEHRHQRKDDALPYMTRLRDRFEDIILNELAGCLINGAPDLRVGNTSNLQFTGIDGKALYAQLLDRGIICAQSSACTSQYPEPSRVLRAMGLGYHEAFSSIRFSVSPLNTMAEIDEAASVVVEVADRIGALLGGVW